MQCAKMQDSTKAATVLDPPSHFANALQISASASPAQVLHVSGESSINESRQEDRHKKSSWIRRLNPRDDAPELSKWGTAEASLDMTCIEKGNECQRMDVGPRIAQPGWFLQEKAANRVRPRLNLGVDSVSDVRRKQMSEQGDLNMMQKRRNTSCQGETSMAKPVQSMTSSANFLPSKAGFGPWVNFSRKPDVNPESILGSKGIIGSATMCAQELSRDSQQNFCSAFASTNSVPRFSPVSIVGDVTIPATFSKSPVPPVHSKIGLPPRPSCQKSPGFHLPIKIPSASRMGRGSFKQFSQDARPNRQVLETPSNSEINHSAGVQNKRTNELTEAAGGRCGSPFQKPNCAEQNFFESKRDHGKSSLECGQQLFAVTSMGNSNLPVQQPRFVVAERANTHMALGQPVSTFSHGDAVEFGNNRRKIGEALHLDVPGEGISGPICTNISSADGLDLHTRVLAPGMENSKSVLKNGNTNVEPNKASMQSPSGSLYGTSTCEKADASVSTSAGSPWEMFIESAGASRIARKQFVETYNRARDELKNQRMSLRMSRAQAKDFDGGPKLMSGPGDTASDYKLRRQLVNYEQNEAVHSQTQGRLSLNPEHQSFVAASNSKEQHSTSHVESKGAVPTSANDQSGLIRDNSATFKFKTPWKQVDNFLVEQSLREGQSRLNVLQKGEEQDNDQIFPIASAANMRALASSKLCEGNDSTQQVARLSHQLESASAVGKSSQEYSIARASENGMGSGVKPLSRPLVWLQRWHQTGLNNFKSMPDTQKVPSDGKRSDSGALGLKKFNDADGVGIFSRSRELKNVSVDKEAGVSSLKSGPSKVLPSAAAMAIVGTAARQFCATQPQRKGSFTFWSGFGMPPPCKIEPVEEKGKAKMFAKEDVDMTSC